MTRADTEEALRLVETIAGGLLASVGAAAATREGADLRRLVGELLAEARAHLAAATLCSAMRPAFDAAQAAGASRTGMALLRGTLERLVPVGAPAAMLRVTGIRFALSEEARILAETEWTSRDDVVRAQATVQAAFESAEEEAADAGAADVYRALVSLHAAVTRDLTSRARPLPRIVTYRQPGPVSALVLSQRLYGTAARADELVAENKTAHPAFMAAAGRALSA